MEKRINEVAKEATPKKEEPIDIDKDTQISKSIAAIEVYREAKYSSQVALAAICTIIFIFAAQSLSVWFGAGVGVFCAVFFAYSFSRSLLRYKDLDGRYNLFKK